MQPARHTAGQPAPTPVKIPGPRGVLDGDLVLPDQASGIVLFAHGSGSSRHSSRNRQVARELQDTGLGALLMDLLSAQEESEEIAGAMRRFDVEMLAERLGRATEWLDGSARTRALRARQWFVRCLGPRTPAIRPDVEHR